jgi:hypothetical protein
MTDMNDDQTPGEVINETISMLPRPDFLNEAAPVGTLRRRGLEGPAAGAIDGETRLQRRLPVPAG